VELSKPETLKTAEAEAAEQPDFLDVPEQILKPSPNSEAATTKEAVLARVWGDPHSWAL